MVQMVWERFVLANLALMPPLPPVATKPLKTNAMASSVPPCAKPPNPFIILLGAGEATHVPEVCEQHACQVLGSGPAARRSREIPQMESEACLDEPRLNRRAEVCSQNRSGPGNPRPGFASHWRRAHNSKGQQATDVNQCAIDGYSEHGTLAHVCPW